MHPRKLRLVLAGMIMGTALLATACVRQSAPPPRPAAGGGDASSSVARLPWKASATGWRLVRRLSIHAGASFSSETRVEQGTVVLWKNKDFTSHVIAGQTEEDMRSPLLGRDESFAYLFEVPGSYVYVLDDNPRLTGRIEVVESDAVNGVTPPLQASVLPDY